MFRKILRTSSLVPLAALLSTISCKQKKYETYIWGSGKYQARPDAVLQFKNFTPKKITNLPQNLVSLHFGQLFEAGIDDKGQLYIWDKYEPDANVDKNSKDNLRENIRALHKDVKAVRFTSGYVWVLDNQARVFQYPVLREFNNQSTRLPVKLGECREVQPLRGTIQLETGRDHVAALNKQGEVYAMGDDTYGQCGQASTDRSTSPPFTEFRIKFPVKVKGLPKIVEISSGADHILALDAFGGVYGWGSNSNLQLSHEEEFSRKTSPLLCSFLPMKITRNLDHVTVSRIASGDEFNILVGNNNQSSSNQTYSFGTNIRGQLGIDEIRHLKDVSKIEKLSNYMLKNEDGSETKIEVSQVRCGKNHCIALLNIGYVMEWGDNEHGQMGNKRRSSCMVPNILRDFEGRKVVSVWASENNSGVIVEAQPEDKQGKQEKPRK